MNIRSSSSSSSSIDPIVLPILIILVVVIMLRGYDKDLIRVTTTSTNSRIVQGWKRVSIICHCNWQKPMDAALHSCGNPHTWSWSLSWRVNAQRLLVEELLCLCIQRCALLDGSEASDLQRKKRKKGRKEKTKKGKKGAKRAAKPYTP